MHAANKNSKAVLPSSLNSSCLSASSSLSSQPSLSVPSDTKCDRTLKKMLPPRTLQRDTVQKYPTSSSKRVCKQLHDFWCPVFFCGVALLPHPHEAVVCMATQVLKTLPPLMFSNLHSRPGAHQAATCLRPLHRSLWALCTASGCSASHAAR